MALPDYSNLLRGTDIEWSTTGGKLITLTSLANGSAREGAKSDTLDDSTYGMPEILTITFESAVAVAATSGNVISLYFGWSNSATAGTNNPSNLTGADAGLSNPTQLSAQSNFVADLALSNALGTGVQRVTGVMVAPVDRYFIPWVLNSSGQALSGTAGDHKIIVTPWYRRIQD